LNPSMGGYQGSIERAAPALAATYAISRAVSIPVMTSSGVSEVNMHAIFVFHVVCIELSNYKCRARHKQVQHVRYVNRCHCSDSL
jgi:Protein of unknown function (DUF561)